MKSIIKNIIKYAIYKFVDLLAYKEIHESTRCDILFLHQSQERVDRTNQLKKALELKGYSVKNEVIKSPWKILTERKICKKDNINSKTHSYLDGYACYLVESNQPKIIITFTESSYLNKYLMIHIERYQGKIINFAHAVTTNDINSNKYFFHYFFVFGKSSLEAALKKAVIGETKIVMVGAYYMSEFKPRSNMNESKKILFCSQGHSTLKDTINRNMKNIEVLAEWAEKTDYKILFKFHPLEDEKTIMDRYQNINFTYLEKNTKMADVLDQVDLVILSFSNASLEAALANVPIVVLDSNDEYLDDYLELEKYYLPRAKNVKELNENITYTLKNYEKFIKRGQEFVSRHIEHKEDCVMYATHCIDSIIKGILNFEYVEKKGKPLNIK